MRKALARRNVILLVAVVGLALSLYAVYALAGRQRSGLALPPPSSSPAAALPRPTPPGAPARACATAFYSTAPALHVEFPEQQCTFTLAQARRGVILRYSIVATEPVVRFEPMVHNAGHCNDPGPARVFDFPMVHGRGQFYGVADTGLCAGGSPDPLNLVPGRYPGALSWDGQNWHGPSDYFPTPGPPFPAGLYVFEVLMKGRFLPPPWAPGASSTPPARIPYEVISGTLMIELVP